MTLDAWLKTQPYSTSARLYRLLQITKYDWSRYRNGKTLPSKFRRELILVASNGAVTEWVISTSLRGGRGRSSGSRESA